MTIKVNMERGMGLRKGKSYYLAVHTGDEYDVSAKEDGNEKSP